MTAKLDCKELVHLLGHPVGAWRDVDVFEQVDSTNVRAAAEPTPWRIVVAAEQTAGRGRQGRSWASPPGTSVAMSMVVPAPTDPQDLGWVPLATGLAVTRALTELTGRPGAFGVKWPNDVLADPLRGDAAPSQEPGTPGGSGGAPPEPGGAPRHKVCGILCQVASPGLIVIGVGINVSAPPQSLPTASAPQAGPGRAPAVMAPTSVSECAAPAPTREQVVEAVARHVAGVQGAFTGAPGEMAALRESYLASCVTLGRDVEIYLPGSHQVLGTAESVDREGKLAVRLADSGILRAYAAGDVFHIRPLFGA